MLYCLVLWVWCKMICIRQDFFHFFETRRCTVPAWPGGTAYCYVGEKSPTAVAGSWSNGVVAPFPKTYKAFSQSWNSFRNCCRSANGTTSELRPHGKEVSWITYDFLFFDRITWRQWDSLLENLSGHRTTGRLMISLLGNNTWSFWLQKHSNGAWDLTGGTAWSPVRINVTGGFSLIRLIFTYTLKIAES